MYDVIESIIGHSFSSSSYNVESYIMYCCLVMIVIISVFLMDAVRQLFRRFWR